MSELVCQERSCAEKVQLQTEGNGEFVMIEKIDISNFRCFKKLSLGGLKKFNVLVGPSGSGKTAFLEALFLVAGGSAEIYYRLRKWRGLGLGGHVQMAFTKRTYESVFRELFFGFDNKISAKIAITDSQLGSRSLMVSYKPEIEYSLPLKGDEEIENVIQITPIVFNWKTPHTTAESRVMVRNGVLEFSGTNEIYPIWLVSSAASDSSTYAYNFSDLSKEGEAGPIVEAFCKHFPEVKGLSLESSGTQLAIFAQVAPFKEKVPVGMLSSGMNKYLELITIIASNQNGVVLIDEIENGLYYEAMTPLLASICEFAEKGNVQLIITTHSYAVLESLASVMAKGKEEHFNLMRSSRNANGTVDIRMSRGSAAKAAILQHFEVR